MPRVGFQDLIDLNDDPELAFVEFEEKIRAELWDSLEDGQYQNYIVDRKIYYVTKLMAFHDSCDLSFLKKPLLMRTSDSFDIVFDDFLDEVNYWTTQISVRHARRLKSITTVIELKPEMKQKIHVHIDNIRNIILSIDLPPLKLEAILGKLNALSLEIDLDRTKTQALIALAIEVASGTGSVAKEIKPVKDMIDSITNLFGKAKELYDSVVKLPGSISQKQIEGPKKSLPAPKDKKNADDFPSE